MRKAGVPESVIIDMDSTGKVVDRLEVFFRDIGPNEKRTQSN